NILTAAGIPGVRDVFVPPITNGVNIVVQIKKAYQGQPKQIAAALWGSSAAQYRYKHVTVVEEDIDPASYEQVDWAFAHRVNAGQDGIVVFPGIFGSPIDPSTPPEDRDVAQLGTGLWNRVLIDATRSWKLARRADGGGVPRRRRRAGADPARPGSDADREPGRPHAPRADDLGTARSRNDGGERRRARALGSGRQGAERPGLRAARRPLPVAAARLLE